MKTTSPLRSFLRPFRSALLAASLLLASSVWAEVPPVLDDFSNAEATSLKTGRLTVTDSELGGKSTVSSKYTEGVLRMEGKIVPARGQPGFVSFVLLLDPMGAPQDLSKYTGIEVKVRVLKGGLTVLAASSEVVNYDYHSMPVTRSKDFQVVRIPFKDMKRVWSEQTTLNLSTITSVNFVASGMQPGAFLYELDEVRFY